MGVGRTIGMIGGGVGGFFLGGPAGAALGAAGGGLLGDQFDEDPATKYQPSGRIARDAPRYGGLGLNAEADRASRLGAEGAAGTRFLGRQLGADAASGQYNAYLGQRGANDRAAGLYGDAAGAYGRAEGNASDAAAARGDSMAAIGRLRSFYEQGPGPSAAEAQLRMGQDANARNALSIARTGGGSPSAVRAALRSSAVGGAQTNQQAGVIRAQEAANWQNTRLNAMGAEQNALSGVRAGDVGIMGQRFGAGGTMLGAAGGAANTGLGYGNLGAAYGAQGIQGQLGAEGMAIGQTQAGEAARQGILGNQLGADTSRYGADRGVSVGMANIAQRDRAADMNMYGSLIGSGVNMLSDVRAKENIRPVSAASIVERLDALEGGARPAWLDEPEPGQIHERVDRLQTLNGEPGQGMAGATNDGISDAIRRIPPMRRSTDLRPAGSYAWDYKDPRNGPDNQVTPMAQELEQTAAAGAVSTGPDGMKRVDPARLTMTNTAAIGEQQRRLDELEALVARAGAAPAASRPRLIRGERY